MLTMQFLTLPDLSSLVTETSDAPAWQNGWYECEFLAQRSFTDRNGNERVFESNDAVSMNGDSRNIRLQVRVKRADGREMFINSLTNYRPTDLAPETVSAVIADAAKPQDEQDTTLTRSRLTLQRLAKLQKIAGIASFHGSEEGGLDLTPLYGKKAYVRLKDDDRNPAFKAVADFRHDRPTKAQVF